MPAARPSNRVESQLRAYALRFPEAYEEFPWGERVIKVRGKIFVFMGTGEDGFGMSVKLPSSSLSALMLPFAQPTGYGLGKSGWVSAKFGAREKIPVDLLRLWIEESYRAVAPKKLAAGHGQEGQKGRRGQRQGRRKRREGVRT